MTDINDVWEYIEQLQTQSGERRKKNTTSFSVTEDVYQQIPFFTCPNHLLNSKCQSDISKYVYCTDTNTPVYDGSYYKQPQIWIHKHFTIKNALSLRESIYRKEIERNNGR